MTYRQGIGTTQFLLQSTRVGLRNTGLVRVEETDNTTETQESRDEDAEVEEALARGDVGILFGTENTEDFVLFVDGLAEVPLLLLIPPATVRISECSLHAGRVSVTAVL